MAGRILVTFASKRGGTADLALRVADVLRARGHDVDCRRAGLVTGLAPYDTVIVGGALYAGRWPREARRFILRNAAALRARRVWLFSSGPLDDSARERELPPTREVARLAAIADARGHVTFGGRLARDARGFIASAMAKTRAGDWRDWDRVQTWAELIATTLAGEPARVTEAPPRPQPRWLVALCAFVAITALGGGLALLAAPDGSLLGMTVDQLALAPFATFAIPGLLLFGVIGLGNLAAAFAIARRTPHAAHLAFGAGCALMVWMTTEMVMVRDFSVLQPLFQLAGAAIVIGASRLGTRLEAEGQGHAGGGLVGRPL